MSLILYSVLGVCSVFWIVILFRILADKSIWKTKKDFSFDELDKLLTSQDYKYEVNKYLHKYKSDRRWYENRIARGIGIIIVLTILMTASGIMLLFVK